MTLSKDFEDFIKNKQATGRIQDLADIQEIKKIKSIKPKKGKL